MRAIFHPFEDLTKDDILVIEDDRAHHLNVVRVKVDEVVKIFNGKGKNAKGIIKAISKNKIQISILQLDQELPLHRLSLAIALPKKDAFEDILKMAVELGVEKIYPLKSEFSQYEFIQNERIDRLLESALIQSNNSYFPIISKQQSLGQFLESYPGKVAFFNSQNSTIRHLTKNIELTILIGPEGGFSSKEIDQIRSRPEILEIHLPTPILRAPTAVAASIGYLLSTISTVT